jgi:hypothetical protein
VKSSKLVATPPGVVTEVGPVLACAGTTVSIWRSEITSNVAGSLANATDEALVNPVPVIVTGVPTGPLNGRNDKIVGVGEEVTVKSSNDAPVPAPSVTEIGPVVAPVGTVAVICVGESTENDAAVPSNATSVTGLGSWNPVPRIVTGVPTGPLNGRNDKIVGGGEGVTVKSSNDDPVPSPSVTEMGPVVAPLGTVAVICVVESTVNDVAAVPLNATPVAGLESWKPSPVIVTDVPTGPLKGRNESTTGEAA